MTDMTFACVSRQDYDRMYSAFADSNAATLALLDARMADGPGTSVADLRAWGDLLAADFRGDLGLGAIRDGVVFREVDGRKVTVDIIEPLGAGPHPVLVYFHGGGWAAGSSRHYRQLAFRFAEAGFVVFNVDYRLAPESPFPGPYEDCEAAVRWVGRVAAEYGGDPTRIAIGGDSAGGNLAAAVSVNLAGDPTAPEIRAALLIYGVFDMREGEPNFLSEAYLGTEPGELLSDPRVSPIVAAAKLPPSFVVVGSKDFLVDQSAALAASLDEAGVTHEHVVVPDMPHAFVNFEVYPEARQTIDQMATFLHKNTQPT
jgi:acetyl esterase